MNQVTPNFDLKQSVQSAFSMMTNWQGRASRPAFWWFTLAYIIAAIVTVIIVALFSAILGRAGAAIGWLLYTILILAFILPSLSVTVRRLHDTGKSGWWWWIQVIPFGGIVILVFMLLDSDQGDNQYGPNPQGGISLPAGEGMAPMVDPGQQNYQAQPPTNPPGSPPQF